MVKNSMSRLDVPPFRLWRGLVWWGVAAAALFLVQTNTAAAKYSSIVIDAETGATVSEHDADSPNYPASLTKMMTLYLTFESLEQGKLHLDQRFSVSPHAANQAPSKLGLEPGDTIALRDLILALVTHSANDAAVVLAEGQAGSEGAFAERMTAKAHALGMASTTFYNASGLPEPDQLTTARDLARLARGLYHDFPKEYAYFATEEFTYKGVSYANHNHLMSAFRGMDGIKTGYIRASGFNLAASAVRDNRRLIGVVMGGESAHSRDLKMAELLNTAFAAEPTAPTMPTVEVADADTGAASVDDDHAQSHLSKFNALARRAARTLANLSPVSRAEAATTRVAPRHQKKEMSLGWSIQVGAFAQHLAASRAGERTLSKLPSARGKGILVVGPTRGDRDRVFRTRITHFSETEAEEACRALRKKHLACVVVAPNAEQVASR
jgi:D-alanyl-D-alanine carboxypeptidase